MTGSANDPRFLFYPADEGDSRSTSPRWCSWATSPAPTANWSPRSTNAFTTTTRAGNAIIRKPRAAADLVARPPGAQDCSRTTSHARVTETARSRGHRHAQRAVPSRGRGRPAVHRRRHRRPHDLPDDGGPRHVDVDDDDDGLSTSPRTPNGRTAAATSRPASATGRSASRRSRSWKRYDLVINEALRMVTPLPMNIRRAVRDTDLLGYFIPAGTNVVTWPVPESPPCRTVDESGEVRSRSVHRAAQRAQEAPVRIRAVRRRCAQVHRHGVRSARDQDRSCIGCCASIDSSWSAPATSRATTTAACRCRWMACRSCCGPCGNACSVSTYPSFLPLGSKPS